VTGFVALHMTEAHDPEAVAEALEARAKERVKTGIVTQNRSSRVRHTELVEVSDEA
jgi:hypothetical protein